MFEFRKKIMSGRVTFSLQETAFFIKLPLQFCFKYFKILAIKYERKK